MLYKALQYLNVTSMDSSSWRTKAAYGKVIIPGRGERYVGGREAKFGRKDLSPEDLKLLIDALEQTRFPFIDRLDDMLKSFKGRALINAWITKHFPDVLEERNGYRWLVDLAKELSLLSLDELIELLSKRVAMLNTIALQGD
ncbi:MAG: hypothetical protein JHC33_00005 [Ignisphaera sp.]|nr:hypothetical protein [Ignisphaera sp.]